MIEEQWTENVILADADYVDSVAFDLTVNFERMLGRRIPHADLAQWTECVALDGGMKLPDGQQAADAEIQVILVHGRQSTAMQNFTPGRYGELSGKAVRGRLGEMIFTAVQTEDMVSKDDLLLDTLRMVCQQKGVRRLMIVVPEQLLDDVRQTLRRHDSDDRRTTVFTMQPVQGGAFRQELLGYSLMAALGISGKEIEEKLNN
ncbi:MAG: DUF6621 family protein [Prevotella sp.]